MGEGDPLEATADYDAAADVSPTDGAPAAAGMAPAGLPDRIGRYRIERVLGKGGFGLVYLAHDDQLSRPVAIKVPHRNLVDRLEDAEAYLTEARTVANLDHPHIVPVFDVGSTEQFPCFVVSKYIDGSDLATRLKQSRLSIHETVELVATVAEALHHAHRQGLVHRDIKPGNILLDKSGQAVRGRLRAGPAGAGFRQGTSASRHTRLHESRAGPWRRASGRWPSGYLQPGRGLLRVAGRTDGRFVRDSLSGTPGADHELRASPATPVSTTRSPRNWSGSA